MTDRELHKLSKKELLEIMVSQGEEIDSLREQLKAANQKLKAREISVREAGSIAEASLRLNKVFEAADAAAAQYLESIKLMRSQEREALTRIQLKERELHSTLDSADEPPDNEQDVSQSSSGGKE
jgi:DUF438 domain-containing protein